MSLQYGAVLKRIIVICVDDFGMHDGINRAVFELIGQQRISAISCLVDGPAWQAGSIALQHRAGNVDIGLHLNLTEDFGQKFRTIPLSELIVRSYLRLVDGTKLRHEIERQLDKFEQMLGRFPDFVDGHQHVHQLPVIRNVLINVLNARYGTLKPWLRSTMQPPIDIGLQLPLAARFKSITIGALGAKALGKLAKRYGYRQNIALLGVYGFDLPEAYFLERMKIWLNRARMGDMLMCHPSIESSTDDKLLSARNLEYRVLSGDEFGEMLESAGVEVGLLSSTQYP